VRTVLAIVLLFGGSHLAAAADAGTYQGFALSKTVGDVGDRFMVLDTRTGDIWQLWDAPALGGHPAASGITYMGQVKAGNAPGETHSFQRFNPARKTN
jgi:hypothetical protein